jgi:hypothetical protein
MIVRVTHWRIKGPNALVFNVTTIPVVLDNQRTESKDGRTDSYQNNVKNR